MNNKKDTYYFSHDSNAITDTKILNMRADYTLEGYGLYWCIIEMMRNEEKYRLELSSNTYRAIKALTATTIDIEKYIYDCINEYKLFKTDEKCFWSESLLRRMKLVEEKSERARQKAQKRWTTENATAQKNDATASKSNATALPQQRKFMLQQCK